MQLFFIPAPSGSLAIGEPVLGGTPGDFLKVAPDGTLSQSPVPGIGITIGETVVGAGANEVLFVDGAGKLAVIPHFAYDGTTLGLNLTGASDGRALRSTTPTEAATPQWFERLGGATFGGVFNPVMQKGWNVATNGTALDPAFGTVAINFEGNFETGQTTEAHIVHGTKNNSKQIRAWSSSMHRTTGFTYASVTSDITQFIDANNPGGNPLARLTAATKLFELLPLTDFFVGGGVWSPMRLYDGDGSHVVPSGISSTAASEILEMGVNDTRFGTRDTAKAGGFLRTRPSSEGWVWYWRAAADAGDVNQICQLAPDGRFITTNLVDVSAVAGTAPQFKLRVTSDSVGVAPSVFFRVLGSDNTPYYLPGYPVGA